MFHSPIFNLTPGDNASINVDGSWEGEYSQFALNVLKKLLDDSPGSRVYTIAYTKTNFKTDENGNVIVRNPRRLDKKSYAQNMLRAARQELIKNGFSAARIVAINGGYVNDLARRLEFWFVPAGGMIPEPKPDYIPKKAK